MNEISALHDRFFKASFGRIEVLRDFLTGFLPAEIAGAIDPDSLRFLNTETIGLSFEKSHMDLVVECRISGTPSQLYLLIEHKSSPDPEVFLQMLRYMVALWTRNRQDNTPLMPILPLVFHQGGRPWNLPLRFQETFKLPDTLKPHAVDFAPLLFDLSTVSETTIREKSCHEETIVALTLLKYAFSGSVGDVLHALGETGGAFDEMFLFAVLNYAIRAFEVGDPVVVDAISRSFGGEKIMPSIIDKWLEEGRKEGLQKGLEKGREKGREEGREEGQRKTIEKLLAKGVLSVSEIASILEVNPQWVERIRQELEKGR
ncbi:MAG: Rpn family recombination-promoting nuclease/putative transposase [Leptospirales bacterium]